MSKGMLLPADAAERKGMPITTGVLDYFPLAIAEVAKVSKAGNDQHNPGQPLHWDKSKSTDHADCIPRHLIDRGSRDTDGMRHSAKLAWRALALLETELELEREKSEPKSKSLQDYIKEMPSIMGGGLVPEFVKGYGANIQPCQNKTVVASNLDREVYDVQHNRVLRVNGEGSGHPD